jgi:F-type H+-transporting ATPase subunit delta
LTEGTTTLAGAEPILSGMAGRYATALFELALETKSLDPVSTDLGRFKAMIEGSPDLSRLAANAIKVVASNRRLFAIGDVIAAYGKLVAAHKGETTAEVTVAAPLSDAHMTALKGALKDLTKKDVKVDLKVDPSIIGGLIVKMGSRMVDSSLRTKLNSIKFAMKEVG